MIQRLSTRRPFGWLQMVMAGGLFLSLAATSARAAITEEERQTLQLMINAELDRAVNTLINERQIAKQFFLDYPVEPPTKSLDDANRAVDLEVKQLADKEFEGKDQAYFTEQAADLFPLYKQYSTQTVERADGTKITEKIRDINKDGITIGIHQLRYDELSQESLINFDRGLNARKRDAYVRLKLTTLAENRRAYERRIRPDIEKRHKYEAGYMLIRGIWKPKTEFLQEHVRDYREKYRKSLEKSATAHVYYQNDFVQFGNEWMRIEERNAKLAEQSANATTTTAPAVAAPAATAAPAAVEEADDMIWGE